MTGIVSIHWQIDPVIPPRPLRHCRTCDGSRPFRSSGKIRLNANGRRLDAWLVYKCIRCDATWNLPLLDRAAVSAIAEADLQAMHLSAPDWVAARELDLALLGRFADRIEVTSEVSIRKSAEGALPEDWAELELVLSAPCPTGLRLDRLLAAEFELSRSRLAALLRGGGLVTDGATAKALRKPVPGRIALRFVAAKLPAQLRQVVTKGMLSRNDP